MPTTQHIRLQINYISSPKQISAMLVKNRRLLPKAHFSPSFQNCLVAIIICTLALPSSLSANIGSVHVKIQPVNNMPCAAIFETEDYKGYFHLLSFPGSTSRIDLGSTSEDKQRVKSISVKSGCTALLWGKGGGTRTSPRKSSDFLTYSFAESVPFVQDDTQASFGWACCYCDKCSENVCISSHQLTRNAIPPPEQYNDFSQFVRYSKKVIGIEKSFRSSKNDTAGVSDISMEPIVFLKPVTSFVKEGQTINLPKSLGPIYYELELGVVIGKRGKNIPESEALNYIAGYFIALDMTTKEFVAGKNKTNGPWALGKGFDTACPVGNFIPKSLIPDPNNVQLEAKLNGNTTQLTNTRDMIFKVQQLISYVSKYMTLEPFDTILTGAPQPLGPIQEGNVVEGRLDYVSRIEFEAVRVP